jgi:alpha-L-rhamnosidase
MAGFYAKTVRDWADAARPGGDFTDTAPFVGINYCGVGWAMVHPLLLEQLYQYYGDLDLIKEQLPAAIRWFENEASRREKAIVTKGLGDHEALTKARGPALGTPMFIDTALRMSRLCKLLGNDGDARRFDAMASESTAAWEKEFLDPSTGRVEEGTQSMQAFALGFNAVSGDKRSKVFDQLVADLTKPADGPQLTTGIYGTRILLEELSRGGRSDLAHALATRKTFPSWGWMLENGATTLWEDWKGGADVKSHNHPMFGSISAWFYRWLGGIQPAADAAAFDRIVIRPQVVNGLEWVKCSHRSVRGKIESNWKTAANGTEFEIIIPPDIEAAIELPAGTLTESGKPLAEAKGITVLKSSGNRLTAGAGRYLFLVAP